MLKTEEVARPNFQVLTMSPKPSVPIFDPKMAQDIQESTYKEITAQISNTDQ